jgi:hypothetical protein
MEPGGRVVVVELKADGMWERLDGEAVVVESDQASAPPDLWDAVQDEAAGFERNGYAASLACIFVLVGPDELLERFLGQATLGDRRQLEESEHFGLVGGPVAGRRLDCRPRNRQPRKHAFGEVAVRRPVRDHAVEARQVVAASVGRVLDLLDEALLGATSASIHQATERLPDVLLAEVDQVRPERRDDPLDLGDVVEDLGFWNAVREERPGQIAEEAAVDQADLVLRS